MDNDDSFPVRIGMFFYVIGGGIFVIFIASDFAGKADFDYLFIALMFFGVGWMFRREKKQPPPADRFAYVRKMRENMQKKKKPPEKKK
ncbi:MAG: hypothetical protein PHQ36_12310 [Anaerolineales bacterium]|nr:hypothetical protein [Anaerolineales bacterium]